MKYKSQEPRRYSAILFAIPLLIITAFLLGPNWTAQAATGRQARMISASSAADCKVISDGDVKQEALYIGGGHWLINTDCGMQTVDGAAAQSQPNAALCTGPQQVVDFGFGFQLVYSGCGSAAQASNMANTAAAGLVPVTGASAMAEVQTSSYLPSWCYVPQQVKDIIAGHQLSISGCSSAALATNEPNRAAAVQVPVTGASAEAEYQAASYLPAWCSVPQQVIDIGAGYQLELSGCDYLIRNVSQEQSSQFNNAR